MPSSRPSSSETGPSASSASALDAQADLPAVQRLRSTAVELLVPTPGSLLIDAGCGTGDMTRQLAAPVAPVAPGEAVIGVDTRATMLAEARRRTTDPALAAAFCHGDVTGLDLATARFDGAYSERVFQDLGARDAALTAFAGSR